jgi:hypothetical protein
MAFGVAHHLTISSEQTGLSLINDRDGIHRPASAKVSNTLPNFSDEGQGLEPYSIDMPGSNPGLGKSKKLVLSPCRLHSPAAFEFRLVDSRLGAERSSVPELTGN